MESSRESKRDINLRLGTAVKSLRRGLGISQETLAERAGLDRTYIGHVERGARNVSLSTIDRLARALEVPITALLVDPAQSKPAPRGARREGGEEGSLDILLVEDNRRDVDLTLRAFKRARITNSVHVVGDGAEALDFLFCRGRHGKRAGDPLPRVVLLDINLPKIDGMEVLRRLKADPRTRRIHVIVLTVTGTDSSIAEAMRLGASAYIVKPVEFQNFHEIVPKLSLNWALVGSAPDSD